MIPVGNLDVYRDMGGVDDLVEAFLAVAQRAGHARAGLEVFNVCSGTSKSLKRLSDLLAQALEVNVRFERDESRVRVGEPISICGSYEHLHQQTGWKPRIRSEEDLIRAFLAD